jgi:dTDP-4-dehydrorhamnose reductase
VNNYRPKRSLIVGASGQVGAQLAQVLRGYSENVMPLMASRRPHEEGMLSIDLEALRMLRDVERVLDPYELGAIYCAGGMTNVEWCEREPGKAMRINCDGPAVLAEYAAKHGVPFLYFSTDYVFDGDNGPYGEDAKVHPLSVYGRSKVQGEQAVLAVHACALILRTTTVYGPDAGQKNFLYTLRRNLTADAGLRVAIDQWTTPTFNRDLAAAAVTLTRKSATGLYNIGGPEWMSRYTLARRAAAIWKFDEHKIIGVETKELQQVAMRPMKGGLLIDKLARLHPEIRMLKVEAALSEWISQGIE